MPVILKAESYDLWLSKDSRPVELRDLLRPFPAPGMTTHAVSYDVNYSGLDSEHLVKPVGPNLGVTPNLF